MKNFISLLIMTLVTILTFGIFGILLWLIIQPASEENVSKLEQLYDYVNETTQTSGNEVVIDKEENEEVEESEEEVYYYNEVVVSNYFYNQLPEAAKTIYRGIKVSEEEMKTGDFTIEYGEAFSNILSQEEGDVILGQYFQLALQAYRYDNPHIFYIDTSKLVLNMEETKKVFTTKYNAYINSGDNLNYLEANYQSRELIDKAVALVQDEKDRIITTINGSSTYDKVKGVHDYLVDNLEYDRSLSNENIYNIYGALINKLCVCEGYAEAMQYILSSMGIECIYVVGDRN